MRSLLDLFKIGGFGKSEGRRSLWLGGLASLGIILLVTSGLVGDKPSPREATQGEPAIPQSRQQALSGMSVEEESLSKRLCEMLRQVEGAGKVEVSVRLSGSTRAEYAVNTSTGKKTTQERDQSGGTRLTTEDSSSGQIVMNRSGNNEQPVIEREVAPKISGVLVVAEGAGDARVKAKLFEATRVALGVEPHKILVLQKELR